MGQRRVVGYRVHFGDRMQGQEVTVVEPPILNHAENNRCCTRAQVGGRICQIGITHDHVQPTPLLGICVRFIAGVDDRSLERGLQPNLHFKKIGPLRELKAGDPSVLADAHSPGSSKDLSCDEQWNQMTNEFGEGSAPANQIVLVAAVRHALVIRVVLVEDYRMATGHGRHPVHGTPHDLDSAAIPQHSIARVGHFWR